MRPESPCAVAFVRALAFNSILQSLVQNGGIRDGLGGKNGCFAKMVVMSYVADEISGAGRRNRQVDATVIRDAAEPVLAFRIVPQRLHGMSIVIDRYARRHSERHQPEQVSSRGARRARKNPNLILSHMKCADVERVQRALPRRDTLANSERRQSNGNKK